MFEIILPKQFGLEVACQISTINLEDFFAQIAKGKDATEILINAEMLEWCEPVGYALLRSFVLLCKEKGVKVAWKQPQKTDVQNFLEQMGFFEDKTEPTKTSSYCPLLQVSENNLDKATSEIKRLLQSKDVIDSELLKVLDHTISELLQNIFHHSERSYGYISAMTFPQKQKLQVVIADNGIGIRKSLLKNKQFSQTLINDEAALALAVQAKMTSNPKENPIHPWGNAGEGLFWTKEFLTENKGQFYIHSGFGQLFINAGATILKTNGFWQGTFIVLQFDLKYPISAKDIFGKYAPEDNDFEFLNFT